MARDLQALLAAVDLEVLADELLGGHRGHGRAARWPSPVPDHPQTGKSPPMSIFTDRHGTQRWSCWSTGTSGTAIDLIMVNRGLDVSGAIDWLDQRYGHEPIEPAPVRRPPPPAPVKPSPDLVSYVTHCQQLLESERGAAARRWLTITRRLSPDVVRDNRVGFDPGRQELRRARGLPHQGPGIVLPSFDRRGGLRYVQVRYGTSTVEQSGRKYDNPAGHHASKPRLAWPRTSPAHQGPVVVCEGVIDALTVAGTGIASVALIASSDARGAAEDLAAIDAPLVIATDNDPAGAAAKTTLIQRLRDLGRDDVRELLVSDDINTLAQRCDHRFGRIFHAAVRASRPPRAATVSTGCGR